MLWTRVRRAQPVRGGAPGGKDAAIQGFSAAARPYGDTRHTAAILFKPGYVGHLTGDMGSQGDMSREDTLACTGLGKVV